MNKKQSFKPYEKLSGELWKKIPLCENYEISNFGRVKIGQYIVIPSERYGYETVRLHKNGSKRGTNFLVHRLVAENFIPNENLKPEVDHIDTNKKNNKVENLRWCWHLENMIGNSTTLSKLNNGYRKKIIYESIRQDLYYYRKSGSDINYSELIKEKVKEILNGETTENLLKTLEPSNFGNKTISNLHYATADKYKKHLTGFELLLSIDDIHTGMYVNIEGKKSKIVSIDKFKKCVSVCVGKRNELITLNLEDLTPILI